MIKRGLFIVTAWLVVGSGWWLAHWPIFHVGAPRPATHRVHHRRVDVDFPKHVPSESSQASVIGDQVLALAMGGETVAGVAVHQSHGFLVLKNFYGKPHWSRYSVSPDAVTWQGGWRFLGSKTFHNAPVNLVIQNHAVIGVLGYHDAYGRVLRSRPGWVAIATVNTKKRPNPACAPRMGKPLVARIVHDTVWNSKRGHLPRGSLVQYTVYGIPGSPMILGGIEDYGPARCPAPK